MSLLAAARSQLVHDPVILGGLGAGGNGGSGFSGYAGQLMLGIVLFLAVMYTVYMLYKYVFSVRGKNRGFMFGRNKHMRVMEITSVGPGTTIQLVKVSEEYFLIGVTKNQITFLTKTEAPPDIQTDTERHANASPFEKYLNRVIKSRRAGDKAVSPEQTQGETDGDGQGGC